MFSRGNVHFECTDGWTEPSESPDSGVVACENTPGDLVQVQELSACVEGMRALRRSLALFGRRLSKESYKTTPS